MQILPWIKDVIEKQDKIAATATATKKKSQGILQNLPEK